MENYQSRKNCYNYGNKEQSPTIKGNESDKNIQEYNKNSNAHECNVNIKNIIEIKNKGKSAQKRMVQSPKESNVNLMNEKVKTLQEIKIIGAKLVKNSKAKGLNCVKGKTDNDDGLENSIINNIFSKDKGNIINGNKHHILNGNALINANKNKMCLKQNNINNKSIDNLFLSERVSLKRHNNPRLISRKYKI